MGNDGFSGASLGNDGFSSASETNLQRIVKKAQELERENFDLKEVEGLVNCTAPQPVRNKEMTAILGKVLNKPTFFPPVPGFALKLMQGEFANVLVESQRVIPRKLTESGFGLSSETPPGAG